MLLRCISNSIRSRAVAVSLSLVMLCAAIAAAPLTGSLDRGFQLLYNLDFNAAQQHFAAYQQEHADDPMGPVAEASGLLFAELNRLGVLDTSFFARDSATGVRRALTVDPVVRDRFDSALHRAEELARARLASNLKDRNALLAIALVNGLRADYSALCEERYRVALHYTRDATSYAQQLLAICPDCYDAYIATGISRYLIGTMPAPVRWILRLGGFSGDKQQGIAELRLVSERGRYMAPYARILLAIAYIRDKDPARARQLLIQLHGQFPGNPLFVQELARLSNEGRHAGRTGE